MSLLSTRQLLAVSYDFREVSFLLGCTTLLYFYTFIFLLFDFGISTRDVSEEYSCSMKQTWNKEINIRIPKFQRSLTVLYKTNKALACKIVLEPGFRCIMAATENTFGIKAIDFLWILCILIHFLFDGFLNAVTIKKKEIMTIKWNWTTPADRPDKYTVLLDIDIAHIFFSLQ